MISSELIGLLLNKYVLASVGVLISLIMAYFKGSSSAEKKAQEAKDAADYAQSIRLRAAEAKNAFLKSKGDLENEKINNSTSIDSLIGVFDALQSGQSKDDPSNKKS